MREVVVFALVGICATAVHYLSALVLVSGFGVDVLQANIVAYCLAVGVSFLGHTRYTFNANASGHRFVRFVAVSLSALALSQLLLWALESLTPIPYQINLLVGVLVIPVYSFLANKFWVYRHIS